MAGMDNGRQCYLVFLLDGHLLGLPLEEVERVYPRVALVQPVRAPAEMAGILQIGMRRLPVLDVRCFLNLRTRLPELDDVLIEVRNRKGWCFAFPADGLVGVLGFAPEELRECVTHCPEMAEFVSHFAENEGRTIWLYSLERLFVSHDFPALLARCRELLEEEDE